MNMQDRLDRHTGNLAALEATMALVLMHMERAGAMRLATFMDDLRRLGEQPGKDADALLAERRLLQVLERMQNVPG